VFAHEVAGGPFAADPEGTNMTVGAVGKNGQESKKARKESKEKRNQSKSTRDEIKERRDGRKPARGISALQVAALGIIATVVIATVWMTKSPDMVKAATIPLVVVVGLLVGRNYFGGLGK